MWQQTPLKGVWTGSRNGSLYLLISFEAPTRDFRTIKKLDAQIVS